MKMQLNGTFLFSLNKALQIDSNYLYVWYNKGNAL